MRSPEQSRAGSFSVVATADGYSALVLDPVIKFRNSAMHQAGV